MWPFKPADLFRVNPATRPTRVRDDPPIVVVDDFYLHPEKIRDLVLATPYPIWKHAPDSKNFVEYYDCRHDLVMEYLEPQRRIAEIAHELDPLLGHPQSKTARCGNIFPCKTRVCGCERDDRPRLFRKFSSVGGPATVRRFC